MENKKASVLEMLAIPCIMFGPILILISVRDMEVPVMHALAVLGVLMFGLGGAATFLSLVKLNRKIDSLAEQIRK